MFYELTLLGLHPNTLGAGLPKLKERLPQIVEHGELLGCFTSEIGLFNRIAILTRYEDVEALQADRGALLSSRDPYGLGQQLATIERSAYRPFPFMPPIEIGEYGPYYEIRSYGVAWDAMQPTIDAWSDMVPRREKYSKLLMVMESLEIVPHRMVHIWPYKSLDERVAQRKRSVVEGAWPPVARPEYLVSMQSEIFTPTDFSPLK